jgi:hypothetical protein
VTRPSRGRLNGVHAEPGAILGPTDITREYLVVLDNDDRGVTLGYPTPDETEDLRSQDSPRTVAEARVWNSLRDVPDWVKP